SPPGSSRIFCAERSCRRAGNFSRMRSISRHGGLRFLCSREGLTNGKQDGFHGTCPPGVPPAGELVSRRLTPPAQPTGTESAQTLLIPRDSPVAETNVVLVS